MQMRVIQKLGITVSRLGFGAMRMPVKDGAVDYEQAERLVDCLHAGGVNYYDTAFFYHGGQSEPFLRRALTERYPRESFFVATKLPLHLCETPADMDRIFEEQRKNLGVDCIDFYLLHGIGRADWQKAKTLGAPDWLRRLKAEGKIRFAGFSFHDKNEELPPILDENEWDFCQIQLNYADWRQRAADTLYHALEARGIPIIVMEPVRGGGLADLYPEMTALLGERAPGRSAASWAIRWCASRPAADIILSGMSTPEQCEDNVRALSPFVPLTEDEEEALAEVVRMFDGLPLIPCTQCRYCADCPQGIDIPKLFSLYNDHLRLQAGWTFAVDYRDTPAERRAAACADCGFCTERCPQKIGIPQKLRLVHERAEALAKEMKL